MSRTKLSALLDGILEAGWLAAIVVTPLFFNIYSARVFEPDKLTILRSIALVMAGVWLVRWAEEWTAGNRAFRFTWRTPLVLPTLLTVVIYLLSTLLSLNPRISFFGSYQRLQGTFTTLSYIVIFFIVLDRMRTRAQVDRLITTLIVNSLPIALYGFIQRSGRDPLPWGGDVTRRVASNMGNAIFVAAYLIMATPPTLARVIDSFRSILTDKESGIADVLRASAYIFIVLVQVITVYYTLSRGPLIGLLAGLGLFFLLGLLLLQRHARHDEPLNPRQFTGDLARGFGFGLGSLAAAGAAGAAFFFISRGIVESDSNVPVAGALLAALVVIVGFWLVPIVGRRGWRWLWSGMLALTVFFSIGFFSISPGGALYRWAQDQPWIGRLANVLEAETGTGKVRSLIWEGGLEMILPHEPIEHPPTISQPDSWRPDRFNAIRPLVGYGPESMYAAYNRFYPPLLGHYESRTATPDRSHNETFDALIITGLPGFAAYLWLFGSLFYFGLRWVGFLPGGWRQTLLLVLMVVGAIGASIAAAVLLAPHFVALAIPMGMIGGILIYLMVYGFSVYWDEDTPQIHPHSILLLSLISTFVAHFVEINFGIGIASTRTTFWALAGAFVLLGLQQIVEREEVEPPAEVQTGSRKRRRRSTASTPKRSGAPEWLWPALGMGLIGALILSTLAYDFVNNVERLSATSQILLRSLTIISGRARGEPQTSLGILMTIGLTWLATGLLGVSQMIKRGVLRGKDIWSATGVVLGVSLLVGAAFGLALADRHATVANWTVANVNDVLDLSMYVSNQLSAYYGLLALLIVTGGLALIGERKLPHRGATPVGGMALMGAVIAWIAFSVIQSAGEELSIRPIGLLLALLIGVAGAALVGFIVYLLAPDAALSASGSGWAWGALATLVLFLAIPLAYQYNLNPIRADVVFKQADPWEQGRQWTVAVPIYEQAIELSPNEDHYYLYLGRALLEHASGLEEANQQELVLRRTEQVLLQAQDIHPLNTDHSANLARLYRRWADLPSGREQRPLLGSLASRYYEVATGLSPNNAIIWNEWATLAYYLLNDVELHQQLIDHSLQLDREFETTWLIVADVRVEGGDYDGAIEAYETALEIKPNQHQVWNALGRVYFQQERYSEAIEALREKLRLQPTASDVWDTHRMIALAYFHQGLSDQALIEAQFALQMAPEEWQPTVQQLIDYIQQTAILTEAAP